jgi:small-conductance mechanosensitive channel
MIEYFENNAWAVRLLQSLLFVVVMVLFRAGSSYVLDKHEVKSNELRLRWKVQVRNFSFILLILGLLIIWATELKTLALSLVAVAVGLILATKELIMCVTGSFFKASSGSFSVGDRIIVGDFRGDVVDQTLLSTTLIEIGPGKEMHQQTGRAITLPNSIFVSTPVINESYRQDYVLHGFTVPISLSASWEEKEKLLLDIAHEVCSPYYKEAERHLVKAAQRRNVDAPSIEPRLSLSIQAPEQLELIMRVPAPVRQRGKIEQAILHRFLEESFRVGG